MNFNDKVILITGASSGIGAATALKLAEYKVSLILTARREELLQELCNKVERKGSRCAYFCGDATNEAHAAQVVRATIEKHQRIDIAILNVGIGPPSNSLTASAEKIKHCMEVNYFGMINFFVPLLEQMKKQKSKCIISHMNSQATWFGIPMQGDYTAAKAAGRIFMETARMELDHFGFKHILIQTIHPGFVDTDAVRNDGIPAPNEISEERAAEYVLRGIKKELNENVFPTRMKWQTRFGRILPFSILKKVLLSQTPKDY